jgi:uncharacterized protein (TIGR03000 family)
MYSIVLMMALTGGAETPSFGGHRCHGCNASCAGASCHGCNGGHHRSHGCCGCHARHHREHGCHARHRCHGCNGGCNGYACSGHSSYGCNGGYMGPVHDGAPMQMPPPPKGEQLKAPPKPATEEASLPAPARIVVNLPAEAKLLIDGNTTKSTTATRVFASPSLEPGQKFHYTLEGEIVRNGRTFTTSKDIAVRAGEEVQVQLDFPQ